jgi:hypothetical protein
MGVESASYISQLVNTNPVVGDPVGEGDDHLRLIKAVLQLQFPNLTAGAVNTTQTEMNLLDGVTALISLATANTWTAGQIGEITALTSATTVTIDMANSNNFSCTMAHNIIFANPSNDTAGQSGSIFLTQDGTGSRTASWNSDWDFIGGTAPTLTTTAAAVDRIDYVILDATNIQAVATLNYS